MSSISEIQKAYDILNAVVQKENGLHLMDMTMYSSDVDVIQYEILPVLESIIDYEPSDEELCGEPSITMNEMHSAAHKMHIEMHS